MGLSVMEIDDVFIDDIADSLIDSHWKEAHHQNHNNGVVRDTSISSVASATASHKVSTFLEAEELKKTISCGKYFNNQQFLFVIHFLFFIQLTMRQNIHIMSMTVTNMVWPS